jgi:hypothetical protein
VNAAGKALVIILAIAVLIFIIFNAGVPSD